MNRNRLLAAVVVAGLLAACSSSGAPTASNGPISQADAVRLVLAQDGRFAGIGPADPDLIGQAAWYEVATTADGWQVRIRIGWGDCPAGCISQHRWVYAVSGSGEVSLVDEEGDPLPASNGVHGVVIAGPSCPVVTDPPDPDCRDRPVPGAVIVVLDRAGRQVARVTSDADGTFSIELAPGAYRLVPQPVEGLMGTAGEQQISVAAGEPLAEVIVAYDTGIR
jgi:hypothetical protein